MSTNEPTILDRTRTAIGDDLIVTLQKKQFCIVGCGGTGALFAEMLVRTGANKLVLIDGDDVEYSNLNRVIGFTKKDVGHKKVCVLKSRFEQITSDLEIETVATNLRKYYKDDKDGQIARDAVCDADIIIIAVDNNEIRIECEKLSGSYKKMFMGIGVFINEGGHSGFECAWMRKTPEEKKGDEGYGAGSYISIVVEATSVAFSMLLHHLKNPNSDNFRYYYKEYKDHAPLTNCQ